MKMEAAMGSEGLPLLPIDGLSVFFEWQVTYAQSI